MGITLVVSYNLYKQADWDCVAICMMEIIIRMRIDDTVIKHIWTGVGLVCARTH